MKESKSVGAVSFVLFLCLLISLFLVNAGHAQPTISGSNQRVYNGSQTLTVSGGSAGETYGWAITSGEGSLFTKFQNYFYSNT